MDRKEAVEKIQRLGSYQLLSPNESTAFGYAKGFLAGSDYERKRAEKLVEAISFLCMHSEGKNMDGTDRRNTDIEECGRNWDKAIKNAKEALAHQREGYEQKIKEIERLTLELKQSQAHREQMAREITEDGVMLEKLRDEVDRLRGDVNSCVALLNEVCVTIYGGGYVNQKAAEKFDKLNSKCRALCDKINPPKEMESYGHGQSH